MKQSFFLFSESLIFHNSIFNDFTNWSAKLIVGFSSLIYLLTIKVYLIDQRLNRSEYYVLVLTAILGFSFLCSSNELMTVYIALELQGLAFYVMASFQKSSSHSVESGLKYFIIGSFSTTLFLFGSNFFYGICGTFSIFDYKDFFIWSFSVNSFFILFKDFYKSFNSFRLLDTFSTVKSFQESPWYFSDLKSVSDNVGIFKSQAVFPDKALDVFTTKNLYVDLHTPQSFVDTLIVKTDLTGENFLIQTIFEKINASLRISESYGLNDKFRLDKSKSFLNNLIQETYPWKFHLNDTISFLSQKEIFLKNSTINNLLEEEFLFKAKIYLSDFDGKTIGEKDFNLENSFLIKFSKYIAQCKESIIISSEKIIRLDSLELDCKSFFLNYLTNYKKDAFTYNCYELLNLFLESEIFLHGCNSQLFDNYKCITKDLYSSFIQEHEILTKFDNLKVVSEYSQKNNDVVFHNSLETLDNKDRLYKKIELFIGLTETVNKFSIFLYNTENTVDKNVCNDLKTEFFLEKNPKEFLKTTGRNWAVLDGFNTSGNYDLYKENMTSKLKSFKKYSNGLLINEVWENSFQRDFITFFSSNIDHNLIVTDEFFKIFCPTCLTNRAKIVEHFSMFLELPSDNGFILNQNMLNTSVIPLMILIFLTSLFLKLGLTPFHLWSPDVYEGSPSSTTFFFLVVSKIVVFVFLLRICYLGFYSFINIWQFYALIVAILSVLVGSIAALKQRRIKSMLAYSSISNMGLILLAFSLGTFEGVKMVFYFFIIYTFSGLSVWSIFLMLKLKNSNEKYNKELGDLTLLNESHPVLAYAFVLTVFTLAGIPPMAGFLAKLNIFLTLILSSFYYSAFIVILSSVIATFYYIRLLKISHFEEVLVGRLFFVHKSWIDVTKVLLFFSILFFFISPSVVYFFSHKMILFLSKTFY